MFATSPACWLTVAYRRVLFTSLVIYMCWQIFATVVFDPLLDWADEEWEALSDKEKEEMENLADDDEPILFLPFPFTTKAVTQPPYRGTDPEWEMFVTVNKDKKLQNDIKSEPTCGQVHPWGPLLISGVSEPR